MSSTSRHSPSHGLPPIGSKGPHQKNRARTSAQPSTTSKTSLPPITTGGRRSRSGTPAKISSRDPKLPTSIDDVHRQVDGVVRQANEQLKIFRTGYKLTGMNFESFRNIADELNAKERVNNSKEAKSFTEWLDIMDREVLVNKEDDLLNLKGFCDKVNYFVDEISPIILQVMRGVKDYATKFLYSLYPEPDECDISLAIDYDRNADKYRNECKKQMKQVDKILGDVENMLSSFVEIGIPDAAQFNEDMDAAEACLTKVCRTLKQWLGDDKYYIGELWDEMKPWNDERDKLTKQIKNKERNKKAVVKKITKALSDRDELRIALHQRKQEKNKLIEREVQLNQMKEKADECKQEKWDKQLQRLAKEREKVEDKESMIHDEIKIQDTIIEDLERDFKKADMRLLKANRSFDDRKAYIDSVKCLHALKTSPATLRNIYFDRGQQRNTQQDDLNLASRLVADNIGDEWLRLYYALPFNPTRGRDKRNKDIDDIKNTCLHKDLPSGEYPWYAMLKWRTFHRKAEVKQLCKTLRKIDYEDLALKIEGSI